MLCSGERIFFPPIGAVLQEIELGLGSELMRGHTKAYAPYAHAPANSARVRQLTLHRALRVGAGPRYLLPATTHLGASAAARG